MTTETAKPAEQCFKGKSVICYCSSCHAQILEDIENRRDEVREEASAMGWAEPDFCTECGEDYCECEECFDGEEE